MQCVKGLNKLHLQAEELCFKCPHCVTHRASEAFIIGLISEDKYDELLEVAATVKQMVTWFFSGKNIGVS